jgi:ribosomal protein S18 acetylase RimI-like enzyme
MEDMVKRLKTILDPDAVWFIQVEGKPVGFALGFPYVNPTMRKINGRLFPFGFLKLLSGVKKERRYRLLSLAVLREYQGQGLDVLLYRQLYKALAPRNIVLEANYILEDNYKIRNALEKLDLTFIKKYRIYEKPL